jgi:RimJ/RimL family protein N-acetyltransferase
LDSDYWKKGYAHECSSKLLSDLKNQKKLKKVYAIVDNNNNASVNVLKKIGFSFYKMINIEENKYDFFEGLSLYVNE